MKQELAGHVLAFFLFGRHKMEEKRTVRIALATANQPNKNGSTYSREALERLANSSDCFELENDVLFHIMTFTPLEDEFQKIIDENFWDLLAK